LKWQRLRPTLDGRSRGLAPLSNHGEGRLNRNNIEIIRLIGTRPCPNIDHRSAPIEGSAKLFGDAGVRAPLR
jgi:hypothetical protein